jgi:hypothetical protein
MNDDKTAGEAGRGEEIVPAVAGGAGRGRGARVREPASLGAGADRVARCAGHAVYAG